MVTCPSSAFLHPDVTASSLRQLRVDFTNQRLHLVEREIKANGEVIAEITRFLHLQNLVELGIFVTQTDRHFLGKCFDQLVGCRVKNIKFIGLHFHIGSQILDMGDFVALCNRVNELQDKLEARRILVEHINVGGGLGIDYGHPNRQAIPNFKDYFATYAGQLKLRPYQTLHFELGRAVVGQCGTLISKVLYVKQGAKKKFAILDAGMTDLIRPALYQAYHKMENLTSEEPMEVYDVVGPICESSDVFGKAIDLNKVKRGDLIALRSAGAYGEIMASGYNCRELPKGYTSDELV